MSYKTREVRVMVCDGCDYDISKQERYTTIELAYSVGEGHHGKMPLHFHEVFSAHDCLRYFFTGYGIMERVLERHQPPEGTLIDTDRNFLLQHLKVAKVAS